MTQELVQHTTDGDVAILHLNQPETLNALSMAIMESLLEKVEKAGKESRAIVLSSRGRAFSSGANLSDGGVDPGSTERDLGKMLDTHYNPFIRMLRDLPVPLVTAIRGPAAGVGSAIALMGDIIVAGKSAYFLQAFCNIGLVPDGGSAYILSRAFGRVRAMEMMLLGERLPAQDAFDAGLINRIVEDDVVDRTAIELAKRLADGPTIALGMIRQAAWAALDSTFDEQLDRERALQKEAGRTDDFVEGVTAFLQKRKAEFKGK